MYNKQPDDQTNTSQIKTNDPFGFNHFSQFYLHQLNQFSNLNDSFENKNNPTMNPIETNIKIWQESINYFSQFLTPKPTNPSEHSFNSSFDRSFDSSINNPSNSQSDNTSNHPLNNSEEKSTNPLTRQPNNEALHQANQLIENTIEEFNVLSQKFINETLKRVNQKNSTCQSVMFDILDGWQQFSSSVIDNSPISLIEQQTNLLQKQFQLYQNTLLKVAGNQTEPIVTPEKGDKRFKDEDWTNIPLFDYLKQSYLLTVNSMMNTIDTVDGIDDKTRQRLSFFTRQWLNAIAPSNFLWSNPEVLRLTKDTGGENLMQGLKQLAEDMEKSAQVLNIRMTDSDAFLLGENIATTPGKVVFRNRMFELIQYTPTTDKVNKRPLVIVPPWINKFYIMDLKEKNSFIKWALDEGQTIFVISWVNPSRAYKDVGMDIYMHEGLLTALDVVKDITGEDDANVIGYCIGGMLLSLTLSWLTENKQDDRIASATFWTTMFDFSDPGDLGVFIDERILSALEQEGNHKGVFDGRMMGVAFSLLRENSLYWNYYIQNYLKGERPTPFDLLYWNSDCTNVTAAVHSFILREFYLGNKLIKKGELEFDKVNIDLSKVKTPTYIVATLQDHIVKWKGSYQSTQVFGGDVTFVLGESGHVAGIINPPTGKYGFYTYDDYVADPDVWFEKAEKQDKSWWLHWGDWIKQHGAGEVPSRQPGIDFNHNNLAVLGDAPGEYVHIRAEEALA